MAAVAAHDYATVDDMLNAAQEKGEAPLLVICDELSDPHNLGAIIRTAECAGAHGVIIPRRRSVGLTGRRRQGLGRCARIYARGPRCKPRRHDPRSEGPRHLGVRHGSRRRHDPHRADLRGPAAIVIGNEGSGMSRLVAESCDLKVSIPLKGHISSLNASTAAAVLLYEAVRQRG